MKGVLGKMVDILQTCISKFIWNENVWISIKILLNYVPKSPINNTPALVQIITWHQIGEKPLSEAITE